MTKHEELTTPGACLNKAKDDEEIFVLLGRDPAAAETVRFWCRERVRLGINQYGDDKIGSALQWIDKIEVKK